MTSPAKNTARSEKTEAEKQAEKETQNQAQPEETENESTPVTKDYILLDLVFVKYKNADDPKSRASKKYKQGQRITLTDLEAESLLAGPRPSVRALTKEERKADED